ncbi:hypothetical protein [Neptunicoccus sediminis]|uniref:hypothetical protein n=1 Tax=Neptunicoccus sediminis TaxID=1892596 RepID=UPI000845E6E5|nr:hypothetical protein [Neptunicoccus sediminis]
MTKTEVKGLKDLEKALLELGKEYGNPKYAVQAMRPAIKAAMNGVDSDIEQNTPVDTGELKETVKTKIGKPSRKMLKSKHFSQTTIIAGRTGYFWKGGSFWFQALSVEFGNDKTPTFAPLRTAFDTNHSGMLDRFKDTLGPAIEKKAKALNKKRGKK